MKKCDVCHQPLCNGTDISISHYQCEVDIAQGFRNDIAALLSVLRAHDEYMSASYEGPESAALHPKAAENWRRVRDAIEKVHA